MGLIQRTAFTGTCARLDDLPVRLSVCFTNGAIRPDKKSELLITIKDVKFGRVIASKSYDVTGYVAMEERDALDFKQAAYDLVTGHYPYIHLNDKRPKQEEPEEEAEPDVPLHNMT